MRPGFQKSGFVFWKWPWVINFCHFLLFFYVEHNFENNQKFGKKWRKALFNLPSTHFSHWFLVAKTRFPRSASFGSEYGYIVYHKSLREIILCEIYFTKDINAIVNFLFFFLKKKNTCSIDSKWMALSRKLISWPMGITIGDIATRWCSDKFWWWNYWTIDFFKILKISLNSKMLRYYNHNN